MSVPELAAPVFEITLAKIDGTISPHVRLTEE